MFFPLPLPPSQAHLHFQLFYLLTTEQHRQMENGGCSQFIMLCLCYFFFLTVFSAPNILGRGQQLLPTHVCCGACLGSESQFCMQVSGLPLRRVGVPSEVLEVEIGKWHCQFSKSQITADHYCPTFFKEKLSF